MINKTRIKKSTFLIVICTICVSCSGVQRADIAAQSGPAPTHIPDHIYRILSLAAYAPSGHNTQPWTVTITGNDSFSVGADTARRLPGVDPDNRELMISMGAFLEAVSIAAQLNDYNARITITARDAHDISIAAVKLEPRKNPSVFTEDDIRRRRIVRKGHLGKDISRDDISFITQDLSGSDISYEYFSSSSPTGRKLASLTVEANRIQAYRDDAEEELSRWIRFRDNDARTHRDGLTPESMEITGIPGFVVRHFYDSASVMDESFRSRSVAMAEDMTSSYGGWILIRSKSSSAANLINTGRYFFRLSLRVRHRMIAIHPMTQILEEQSVKDTLIRTTGVKGDIQFILRTSYLSSYPEPVSLRRAPDDFVIKGDAR